MSSLIFMCRAHASQALATAPAPVVARIGATLVLALLAACAGTDEATQAAVGARIQDDGVQVYAGHRPVFFYRSRPAANTEAWRTHYLHPVFAPGGRLMSEDAPADHPHQRGVFWAWRRILLDGEVVADGWVGRNLELRVAKPRFINGEDGRGVLLTSAVWSVRHAGRTLDLLEESTSIEVGAPSPREFRIGIDVRLRALRAGVALAGSDDEKGYGGVSFRWPEGDSLRFESGGSPLQAQLAAVDTGSAVRFSWATPARSAGVNIEVACSVDSQPWQRWVLRREASMQNCAYPGRTPAPVPVDRPLRLQASIRILEPAT